MKDFSTIRKYVTMKGPETFWGRHFSFSFGHLNATGTKLQLTPNCQRKISHWDWETSWVRSSPQTTSRCFCKISFKKTPCSPILIEKTSTLQTQHSEMHEVGWKVHICRSHAMLGIKAMSRSGGASFLPFTHCAQPLEPQNRNGAISEHNNRRPMQTVHLIPESNCSNTIMVVEMNAKVTI